MPTIIGAGGAEGQMPITLNQAEQDQLKQSADVLRDVIKNIHT